MHKVRTRYIVLFVLAIISTLVSLYVEYYGDPILNIADGVLFSMDRGISACTLCWYIRMCMYPTIFMSGVSLVRKQWNGYMFMQPLFIMGFIFAAWKRSLQHFALPSPSICNPQIPCTLADVNYFGFMSLSMIGMIGFIVMFAITLHIQKHIKSSSLIEKIGDLL